MDWQDTEDGWVTLPCDGTDAALLIVLLTQDGFDGRIARKLVAAWSGLLPQACFALLRAQSEPGAAERRLGELVSRLRVPPARLILVGLDGTGCEHAVALALRTSRATSAGLLCFGVWPACVANLPHPISHVRVRLIATAGEDAPDEEQFARMVRDLATLGADVRANALSQPGFSPAAIRLGAAYLAELAAAALDRTCPATRTGGAHPANRPQPRLTSADQEPASPSFPASQQVSHV
jgi:hypothetical protein